MRGAAATRTRCTSSITFERTSSGGAVAQLAVAADAKGGDAAVGVHRQPWAAPAEHGHRAVGAPLRRRARRRRARRLLRRVDARDTVGREAEAEPPARREAT